MRCEISRVEFRSSDGINTVVSKVYVPRTEIKGVVQIVHGMCEYIDRYTDFMTYLVEQGYVVCGNDHLGHGETCPNKKLLGYFGEIGGYRFLLGDIHKLHLIVKKDFPNVPYFILGHSMGSFLTRVYLTRFGGTLDGVILSGTGGPNPMAKAALKLCEKVRRKKGPMYRAVGIQKLAFGGYNSHYKKPRTSSDWVSSDPEVVQSYVNDEYCNFVFTVAAFTDLFTVHMMANDPEQCINLPKQLPFFLLSGEMDPVGDYGKGIKKVCAMLRKADVEDIALRLYPEGRHEMLHERNRKEVYSDILLWLNEKTSTR